GVRVGEPVLLKGTRRFTGELARIESAFTESAAPREDVPQEAMRPTSGSIERIEAPDRVSEVDAVAREIRLLLARGYRLRDIVVLTRSLDAYEALIATSFDEHHLPYFLDRRRSASHHPLLEFLVSALRVARFDWQGESVMALLKTGLAGLSADEA